jgi:thiol:disulfide interchange protein DsbC
MRIIVVKRLLSLLLMSAVTNPLLASERWYSESQVNEGKNLFSQNCAACHGAKAASIPNWKEPNAQGQYPPPPLNGSAHAWHHDLALLRKTVQEGGAKLGGQMPPFKDKLSINQIDEVLSYVQSLWPNETYAKWAKRFPPPNAMKVDVKITKPATPSLPVDNEVKNIGRFLSKRLGPNILKSLKKTESKAIWQVPIQDRYLYLVDDGKYALIGELIDLRDGRNITKLTQRDIAKKALSSVDKGDFISYDAIGIKKADITVFTDTSCPYCRKLHKEVPELQKAGISVHYLPYARGGKRGPGYKTLKSVWCEKDRHKALTDAKDELTIGLSDGSCDQANVVDSAYALGNKIGVTGTPALFKNNGEKIEGYVPYKELIPMVLNN